MEYMKIEVGRKNAGKLTSCICLNYEQFILDCDKLIDTRYEGFDVNPKDRFHNKVEKILYEIADGERTLPCRVAIRLEGRHCICNCRIDYTFELMDKAFFKENIRAKELPKEILAEYLKSDVDFIMLYVGMNK